MNTFYEYGEGYKALGMIEAARREFMRVNPSEADYLAAWCQLAKISDRSDKELQNRLALEGVALLETGSTDQGVIDDTALCFHHAGNPQAAYDITAKYCRCVKWDRTGWYGFATYAARIEKWAVAAWFLRMCIARGGQVHMFFDLDLEPLYRHVASNTPDKSTALALAHPEFEAELKRMAGRSSVVDAPMEELLPGHLLPHMHREPYSTFLELRPDAPASAKQDFYRWRDNIADRIESQAQRAIENSKAAMLESQLPWALDAARKGNFYAARWHTIFALAQRPDWLEKFSVRLSPLGMGPVLQDLRIAIGRDPHFCEYVLNASPTEAAPCVADNDRVIEAGKGTGFELICNHAAAAERGDEREGLRADLLLMNRWPSDPAGYANAMARLCGLQHWESAESVLRRTPRSFLWLVHARKLISRIRKREIRSDSNPSKTEPFYGQPNIAGLVRSPDARKTVHGKIWNHGKQPSSPHATPTSTA